MDHKYKLHRLFRMQHNLYHLHCREGIWQESSFVAILMGTVSMFSSLPELILKLVILK